MRIKKWLSSPCSNWDGNVTNSDGVIYNSDLVNTITDELLTMLRDYSYKIEDVNVFRKQIIQYIYTGSH